MPKINFASSMLVEDHLKKVLAKTSGKPWKLTNNKLLPKSQHSPFGDFPPEYMKKASNAPEPVPKIEAAEQSVAAKGHCKFIFRSKQHPQPAFAVNVLYLTVCV